MNTKYILHGGEAEKQNSKNDLFFQEILKDTPKDLKILLVLFANNPENNEIHKEADIAQFERVKGEKNIKYEVANGDNFENQIKNSDVIYIGGGKTNRSMEILSKYNNLKELFTGKVVAGESAGANSLSTCCYSKSGGIMKCLGLVPVKTIPHFDGKTGLEELENAFPETESCYLPVFDYKIYWQ